ncbi:MAG: DUF2520 domain-containing protein [Bacteroidota bacterium]
MEEVFASAFKNSRPGVAIVGAGAVGRALGLRLAESGYPILGIISRTLAPAETLARAVGAPLASDRLSDLPAEAAFVLLCVSDDQIADVAETLTGARRSWKDTVVAHTSGALAASVLDPLADEGASVLSFHPLQTLAPDASASSLVGVHAGLEGDPRGVAAGIELAVRLGMRYLVLSPDAKARYHLAATMASNFVVTLLGMVQEVLSSLDIDRDEAMALLAPLLQGTLDNLKASSPEEAITGPVVRGDLATLRQHGLALREHLPHLVPAYAALSVETVRLAVRSGRLESDQAEKVLDLMQRMVTVPLPERDGERPPVPTLRHPVGS